VIILAPAVPAFLCFCLDTSGILVLEHEKTGQTKRCQDTPTT